jgi:hypothetical protein
MAEELKRATQHKRTQNIVAVLTHQSLTHAISESKGAFFAHTIRKAAIRSRWRY